MSTTSALLRASFRVLGEHKRLLLLPAVSIGVEIVILAAFVVPYALTPHGSSADATRLSPVGWVLFGLCYVLLTMVGTFFNAALFIAAKRMMSGDEDASVGAALREALRRAPAIIAWALVAGTIGLAIRLIDRKIPIAAAIAGLGWSGVSFLVLPILANEDVGLGEGLRKSVRTFRSLWAEELGGSVRLGILQFFIFVPAIAVMFFALGSTNVATILAGAAICLLWFGFCVLLISCATGLFRVAVYVYATTNVTPPQFVGIDLSQAFGRRRS